MNSGFNLIFNGKDILHCYDACTKGTRLVDLCRTFWSAFARIENESETFASGISRKSRRNAKRNFKMGERRPIPACGFVSHYCRSSKTKENTRRFSQRITISKKIQNVLKNCLTSNTFCIILYSVESDGVSPKISTARGGSAFSTFAAPSRAFLRPFPLNPNRAVDFCELSQWPI